MTLPAAGTAWPPKNLEPLFDMVNEASAWWEGEAKTLGATYAGKVHASQYNGGVIGATSRFFWGKPPLPNQSQKKLHLPLAADIANASATLLFENAPVFRSEDDATQEMLNRLVNTDSFGAGLLVGAESCSALGGVYWRVQWDTSVSPTPWVTWVDADSVIPEFAYGKNVANTFVEELPRKPEDKKATFRLCTRYSLGRIDYQLMRGSDNDLGEIVPLTDHPVTANITGLDQESGRDLGAPVMLAGYVPNALPNPGFRKSGLLRNMGRPDLSPDLFDLFDMLDETWTSLQRELRLGRMRITVPGYMLENGKPGMGMGFDVDREVYDALDGVSPDDGVVPQFHQPALRVEQHLSTADAIVREVIRRVNLSPLTFGLTDTGTGNVTAREIEAKTKASVQTWKSKTRYWRAALLDIARALVYLEGEFTRTRVDVDSITVELAQPVQETLLDKAQTIQALDSARAVSTAEKVRMAHPEWDSEQQDAEVQDILSEQGVQVSPFDTAQLDHPFDE